MRLIFFNNYISAIVCQSSKIHIFCVTPTGFYWFLGEAFVTNISPLRGWFFFNKGISTIVCQSSKIQIFCVTPASPGRYASGVVLILEITFLLPFFQRYLIRKVNLCSWFKLKFVVGEMIYYYLTNKVMGYSKWKSILKIIINDKPTA